MQAISRTLPPPCRASVSVVLRPRPPPTARPLCCAWPPRSFTSVEVAFGAQTAANRGNKYLLPRTDCHIDQNPSLCFEPNSTYALRVVAVNPEGRSIPSDPALLVTTAIGPPPEQPSAVREAPLPDFANRITYAAVQWTESRSVFPVLYYRVYRDDDLIRDGLQALSLLDRVEPTRNYSYTVEALGEYGGSPLSSPVVISTLPPIPVTPPSLTGAELPSSYYSVTALRVMWELAPGSSWDETGEDWLSSLRTPRPSAISLCLPLSHPSSPPPPIGRSSHLPLPQFRPPLCPPSHSPVCSCLLCARASAHVLKVETSTATSSSGTRWQRAWQSRTCSMTTVQSSRLGPPSM